MGVIQVRGLGDSEIQIGRKRLTLSTEVAFAVAFYLCMHAGERVPRDDIVAAFWGDSDDARGRHSLRQMLYRLRQKGLMLDEDGEELLLDPARVDCDVTQALAETWPETVAPEALESMGELLPGFSRAITPRFRDWLDGLRAQVEAQFRRAALRQISLARREGRWADLERWGRLVLRSDPLNEEATLARAESAAMAGSKAMALEILDQYVEELGDRATQIALPATVLRRRIAERRPEWAGRATHETHLVGRADLMRKLTDLIATTARGEGQAVTLWGAPGVGKTRLASELRSFAEMTGFRSVFARATSANASSPLSLALSLSSLLCDLPGAAGCSPTAMALLQRLLAPASPESRADVNIAGTESFARVTWSLEEVLRAASEESRVLVYIDDIHNCDSVSLGILHSLVAATKQCRIFWIATSRMVHRAQPPYNANDRDVFRRLTVPPLGLEHATALAASLATSVPSRVSSEDCVRIAGLAGGNPLFVRELVLHLPLGRYDDDIPQSLRQLMHDTLTGLTGSEIRLLRIVALLGSLATLSRVRSLSGNPAALLSGTVEHLDDAGLLSLGVGGALELHECWQQALGDGLSAVARASLSFECAELLVAETDPRSRLERTWRCAELYQAAGEHARAIEMYRSAGDQLLLRGLSEQASSAYERALPLCREEVDSLRTLTKLASAEHAAGNLEASIETCTRALSMGTNAGSTARGDAVLVQALLVDALWKTNRDYHIELERLAGRLQDDSLSAEVCHLACLLGLRVVLNDAHSPLEHVFAERARAATEMHGASVTGELVALMVQTERGSMDAVRAADASLSVLPLDDCTPQLQCMALQYRSNAMRWIGDSTRTLQLAEQALTRALAFGFPDGAARISIQMVFACLDDNDLDSADTWLARCEAATHEGITSERVHALAHAKCRVLLQRSQFNEFLLACRMHGIDPMADKMAKRGSVDAASIGFAAAKCGKQKLSMDMTAFARSVIDADRPSRYFDYPAELVLRTLRIVGQDSEADQFGTGYVGRRRRTHARPLSAFCSELRQVDLGILPVELD